MLPPIVFASLADGALNPAPIPGHWIIEGMPKAHARRLSASADGTSSTVAWSCTPGRFNWYYTVDETLYIVSGEVFVSDEKGGIRRLAAGDMAYFPAGSHSVWHVTDTVHKIAFCRHAMPRTFGLVLRAWNKLSRIFLGVPEAGGALEANPVDSAQATAA